MSRTQRALSDRVEIWFDHVDEHSPEAGLGSLDDAERVRAGTFRFARDRARFVARRAFLRRILGDYLGVAPAAVRYRPGATGRPEIDGPAAITVSTSHSDGLAIVAVARGRLVGVDLERLRPIPDALDLARSLFTAAEYDRLRITAVDARSQAFLRLWTRKEAIAKALGLGLSMPFDGFDVVDRMTSPVVVAGPGDGSTFAVTSLDDVSGYTWSVALAGSTVSVHRAAEQAALAAIAS